MRRNLELMLSFYRLVNRKRLALILIGGFLALLPVILNLVSPLVVRDIVDQLGVNGQIPIDRLQLLTGLYVLALLVPYVGERVYNRNKYLAAQELRNRIFQTSFYLPIREMREKGSAYFTHLLVDQVNSAFVLLDYAFLRNIFYIVRMIWILCVAATWGPALFALFLLNDILVIMYSSLVSRATKPHFTRLLETARRANSFVVESFQNVHDIFAGEALQKRINQHNELQDVITDHGVKGEVARVSYDKLLIDLPNYTTQILVLAYCGLAVGSNAMSIGTLWLVWNYLGYSSAPIYVLRDFSRTAVQSAATIESVLSYFEKSQRAESLFEVQELDLQNCPVYDISNLSVSLGGNRVLDGVDLTLNWRDVVGVVGLSGEGKSTLLNVLLGFDRQYEGTVKLLGEEIRGIHPEAIFRNVGYYSQAVAVLNDTLEANIVMGRDLDEHRLDDIVDRLELSHLRGRVLGEAGSFMSGGERQRLQLARLLYSNKRVFVIDEPLVNLDVLNEKALVGVLSHYIQGKTGIIISHKPNVIRLAKTLIILSEGKVVASGSAQMLARNNDIYRRIVKTYTEVARETGKDLVKSENQQGGLDK